MAKVMTAAKFIEKLKDAANHKTLYVLGGIGFPLNARGKQRSAKNEFNRRSDRAPKISAASDDTFAMDCVGMIKTILWGWTGDPKRTYGGAAYAANGVPDIGADKMITVCTDVSTDFSKITPGEAVWMPGHIGVYIGDGLAIECTPIWKDGVQITACNRAVAGYNRRNWKKHGKLPYIDYAAAATPAVKPTPASADKTPALHFYVQTNRVWQAKDKVGIVGKAITAIAVEGDVRYRVHVCGGSWLGWIEKCDLKDYYKGYAGNGKPIDAVQVQGKNGKVITYRVSPLNKNYYAWQENTIVKSGMDGYAGAFGKAIDRLEIKG